MSRRSGHPALLTIVVVLAAVVAYMAFRIVTIATEDKDTRDYPESVRGDFLIGCASGGRTSDAGCKCVLEEMEEQYELREFNIVLEAVNSGRIPSAIREIAHGCDVTLDDEVGLEASSETTSAAAGPPKIIEYPDGGRWVEVNDDETCTWAIYDQGVPIDQGIGAEVIVPSQVAEFRTDARCSWEYAPAG